VLQFHHTQLAKRRDRALGSKTANWTFWTWRPRNRSVQLDVVIFPSVGGQAAVRLRGLPLCVINAAHDTALHAPHLHRTCMRAYRRCDCAPLRGFHSSSELCVSSHLIIISASILPPTTPTCRFGSSILTKNPWLFTGNGRGTRTIVRDLLLGLTSKGAAVVAFDVLFAEPDRTSVEAIVKQLPPDQANAITAALAGQPSNDEHFATALKDTPSVLSVALGEGRSDTVEAKAGFAFGGDDPRPFLLRVQWGYPKPSRARECSPKESVHSTG